MALLWPAFQTTVATFLDTPVAKTESNTANVIATAYGVAVRPAMISVIPGSNIISTPSTSGIESAILDTFNQIKNSEGPPTPPMFLGWANATVAFWSGVQWNPLPPPIGYVAPTTGVTVLSGGTPTPLDIGLWNAFNNPPSPTPMGNIICGKLIAAFTSHLLTVNGIYNGLIPAPPAPPVPGPPFPWLGVV
jgi:hypothetical protein